MTARWVRRVALWLGLALLLVGGASMITQRIWGQPCGAEEVDRPTSPLQSAVTMAQRPDEDRDRIVAAVEAMGPPFGSVQAGTDYYYDQWLHLYGVPGGMLAWTKNNAPVTYLDDETLAPRWSLRPTAKRTAWDVSESDFLLLNLADGEPLTIAEFDLETGRRGWCSEIAVEHRPGDPVSTAFIEGGDVVVALPSGSKILLLRMNGDDGDLRWAREIATADRADYLGMLTDQLVLVGGTEESRLTDPAAAPTGTDSTGTDSTGTADSSIAAVDVESGDTQWTWSDGPGTAVHVVAADAGQVTALVRTKSGVELVTLSEAGKEVRRRTLPSGSREATLRSGVVVVRSDAGLLGLDAETGKRAWSRPIPTDRPYIPLGFSLSQMPSVDADQLLLPTVTSLELLDLRDGTSRSYAMPTEGLSSAYFVYQLLVTQRHLGLVANTGTVLAARE